MSQGTRCGKTQHLSNLYLIRMIRSMPVLISIEGNIGSGKSTLLKKLREAHPEWMFVDEPVDSWLKIRNDQGESLLEVFYKDKQRWSYTFQNAAVLSRGMMVKDAVEGWREQYEDGMNYYINYNMKKERYAGTDRESEFTDIHNKPSRVIIMERCVETDRNVFAKMLKGSGDLDGIEWTLYEKWYAFISEMIPKMNAFIWVDTDPETACARIKTRGREGEESIPLEYLKSLDAVHQEWLEHPGANVFRSQDFHEIETFIKSLDV